MDDPQRLLDGTGTALEQTLLQELRSYRGPRSMRAHTLAAVGLIGSAGIAAGGALAWWSAKTWSARLIVAFSAASVLVGVPVGYFIFRQGPTPTTPSAPNAVAAKVPVPQVPVIAPATTAATPVPNSPASPIPPPVARVSKRSLTTSTDLRAELEALDTIRTTLAGGNILKALSLLDAYFQDFHHGRLRLEAEILRIDALAKADQTEAARSYAKGFLRRHPKSVHAARLQSIVGP